MTKVYQYCPVLSTGILKFCLQHFYQGIHI